MSELEFRQQRFTLAPHESVLDCLLRHGQAVPYACRAGMCQACLVRAVDCTATAESSKWIKPELRARGYTLACQWVPENDVSVALPGVEEFSIPVCITGLQPLNACVMRVTLVPEDPARMFGYRPGQYLNLINPEGVIRSYSIANDYRRDGFLELHVSRTSHGRFTGWLFDIARTGMRLHIRGPAGESCYTAPDRDDATLLLAGTGAGLAPLYAIALAALTSGHGGSIHFCHGGRTPEHLYYREELEVLAARHANFHYHPCVIDLPDGGDGMRGPLEHCIDRILDASGGHRAAHTPHMQAWLCGAPAFVYAQRKRLYLRGLRAANIHCDPFTERLVETSDPPAAQEHTRLT